MNEATDAEYDLIVVGAGAGGMTAAAVGAAEGLSVLLLEKAGLVGGTTAWSGGMVWVPGNRKSAAAGLPDTEEAARRYLAATVPGGGDPPLDAFVARADEAVAYLEAHTPLRLTPVRRYPDYYPDLPGATPGGRVLEPVPLDGRRLGPRFALLRPPLPEFTLFGGMMVSRPDIAHFRKLGRSIRSTARVGRLLAAYAWQRLRAPRGTTLYLGNALAGYLLLALGRPEATLCLSAAVEALEREAGRVTGVVLRQGAVSRRVRARRGVILAAGGFSHDATLRRQCFPEGLGALSAAAPASSGDGVRLGLLAGGRFGADNANGGFWVPVSRFRRADGSAGVYPHTVADRAKPGLIAVDRVGRRFVNEAVSYHEFVLAMLRHETVGAGPAHLLCDARFLRRYGLGRVKPFGLGRRKAIAEGYLFTAATMHGLAQAIGCDAGVLAATVATYNEAAHEGHDPAFGRGGDIYQRHLGDADHAPNPCVAPIEQPPFYAVAVYPADLGTAAGLMTDAVGRVLAADGAPIPGLYACGNDMNSVMNGAYPGPGITLGPALIFGYLAARHAAAGA